MPAPYKYQRLFVLALLCISLGACSTIEDVLEPDPPPVERPPGTELPEPAEPEEPTATTRTVQGYRIQTLTTVNQDAADRQAAEARRWYESMALSERPRYVGEDGELYVKIAWRQPYYRVRLGRFAYRSEAERALDDVTARFSDAFIVPDQVTVTRVW